MKKIFLASVLCFCIILCATAQTKTSVQLSAISHNGASEINQWAGSIQNLLLDKIVANPGFSLLERDKIGLLHQEKELQKSEDFIDGKVVEQGKAIGAQFIFQPEIDVKSKLFRLKVIDVEKESVLAVEKCDIAETLKWQDNDFEKIEKTFDRMLQKMLPTKRIKIVRFNNPKNTELLVAVGQSTNIKKKQGLVIYYVSSEKIEDSFVEREVNVGKAKIIELQGDNFSIAEINDGAAEIQALIQKGTKIYCKIQ